MLALILSIIAFVLGSGPLSASLALLVIALPASLICLFLGPWRMSVTALYWAVAALAAVPLAYASAIRVDHMLAVLGFGGITVAAACFFSYWQTRHVA
jgi:hypothetical protein